ncbi:MAG: peptidase S8/S53 domain-containing protein [Piptocephalis tieghemiana]|nr:MAG: peptidase S8/S53 domain-containing protein [Piptocephalis tieghemiana]
MEQALRDRGSIIGETEANGPVRASSNVVFQSNPPSWALRRISEHSRKDHSRSFVYPETAGANVTVYILDTGIQVEHSDLKGRASWGATFGSNITQDDNGHGTFVAGIIAGSMYGVAKSAKVVAVKVLDRQRSGYLSNIVQGLNWTMSQHEPGDRSIINLSLDTPKSDILNRLIAAASQRGIIVVGSAGNGDKHGRPLDACTRSPGSASAAITVGAIDYYDRLARFSNYGSCVDLFAPGVNIRSLTHDSLDGSRSDEGTSFASSYVAGVAALILGDPPENITLAPTEVRKRIFDSATLGAIRGMSPADGSNTLLFAGGWRGAQDGKAVSPSGDEEEEEVNGASVSHSPPPLSPFPFWAHSLYTGLLVIMILWIPAE